MTLVKYKHNADIFYKEFEKQFEDKGVDFFSCYENGNKNCINCETTFEQTFLNALSKININPEWNFMDCGCGLGFPMYLASSRFKKVFGVEIIPEIAQKAENNLKIMGVKNYEIINSDIRNIKANILKQINVFYLFNPFIDNIFEEFIQNISESMVQGKHKNTWFIYVNAICEDAMKKYSDILPLEFSIQDFRKINFYRYKGNNL